MIHSAGAPRLLTLVTALVAGQHPVVAQDVPAEKRQDPYPRVYEIRDMIAAGGPITAAEEALRRQQLLDLVKTEVRPESWEIKGITIWLSSGQLIVVTTPGIHGEVERYLNALRNEKHRAWYEPFLRVYDVHFLIRRRAGSPSLDDLAASVKAQVYPGSWEPTGACKLTASDGKLYVCQTKAGHLAIATLLENEVKKK